MRWGKPQQFLLLIGDIGLLYASLYLMLLIRYGPASVQAQWELHAQSFSIIFAAWLLVFYIFGFYEGANLRGHISIIIRELKALFVGGLVAIALFYLLPIFIITPRINLAFVLLITSFLLGVWRIAFSSVISNVSKIRVLIMGESEEIHELIQFIQTNPQLGYEITMHMPKFSRALPRFIHNSNINVVVASQNHHANKELIGMLYEILPIGISFIDSPTFYEQIMGKIPVSLISEVWFLENLVEREKRMFEFGKRAFDIAMSLLLGLATFLLLAPVAFFIKIESSGPIFYRQKRIGKGKRAFNLIKFRTMKTGAEKNGAQWASKNDARTTIVGRFLRETRIDELPQFWNILKGDLSLIGPRPERPEFVNTLREEIPFYDMRHLIRPGLSGWAQINPPYYYGSKKEALLKLRYDLFYIKNRNLGLDIAIVLKTLMVILSRRGI